MRVSKTRLKKVAERVLPKNTMRRKVAQGVYRRSRVALGLNRPRGSLSYSQWIGKGEPHVWVEPRTYSQTPLISVVVPTYNTPDKYILPLLESLKDQIYENWQLCIADGSTVASRAKAIKNACGDDERIVYKRLQKNHGIVGNTNEALGIATGEFIGFLDHDDLLSPHALLEVVDVINRHADIELIYSDEDKISDDGKSRSLPFFKPDWSPALLEGVNYITHFLVVRQSLLKKLKGLREGFDGSQDYDFLLRATDATDKIIHIPKILYHWRLADGSTAGPIDNKSYAADAGLRALQDHVKRMKIKGETLARPDLPTNYRIRYDIPKGAKASIIIPFKDKVDITRVCVKSILEKTAYQNYEIILISNRSVEERTHQYLASLKDEKVRIFYYDKPFNYSAINNFGRKQAKGDYIVLLNNDTEVINADWLGELVGVAAQPSVGAVGALLFYPNNKIQHAGIVLGMKTMAGHVFRLLREDALTAYGRPYWPRNYLAVTAACLAIKATKFDEVKGLDEKFIMAGNDVAFGISLHEKGYRNVFWPFAQLYHYENVSVGSYQNAPPGDYDLSLKYYNPYLKWHDPYFNPNLSLDVEQVAYRESYE